MYVLTKIGIRYSNKDKWEIWKQFDSTVVCFIGAGCAPVLVVIVTRDGDVEQGDLLEVSVIIPTPTVEDTIVT